MRRQPPLVGGVACEAAAEMIVDAALGHLRQGIGDGRLEGHPLGPLPRMPQQGEQGGLRELGRRADAAVEGIDFPHQPLGDLVEDARHDGAAGLVLRQLFESFAKRRNVAGDLVRFLMEGRGDAVQHLREARAAHSGSSAGSRFRPRTVHRQASGTWSTASRRTGRAAPRPTGRSCPGRAALPGRP